MGTGKKYEGPCAIESAITVFGGKWKPAIIYHLQNESPKRFSQLRRLIPVVSPRMLTQHLRELERDGLVTRRHFAEIPPRVEYAITTLGRSLVPVFQSIEKWQVSHFKEIEKARSRCDATGRHR